MNTPSIFIGSFSEGFFVARIQLRNPAWNEPLHPETGILELLDIPTTLLASDKIIELILKRESIGQSFEKDKLELKGINIFLKALESLTEKYRRGL